MSDKHAVYIAGPMRGIPEFNFPAFDQAETALKASGRTVQIFNPAARDRDVHGPGVQNSPTGSEADIAWTGFTLRDALHADTEWICKYATAVVVLPGWEASKGARAEVALAKALGLLVAELDPFLLGDDTDPTDDHADDGRTPDGPSVQTFDDHVAVLADCGLIDGADGLPVPDPSVPLPDGEVRVTSSTGGQKGSKPAKFSLLPAGPLWQVAELYGKGAAKYAAHNWRRGYDWSLSFDAMQRHAWSFWRGEDIDGETGCSHLASVVFHAFALMEYGTAHPEFDNRYTSL